MNYWVLKNAPNDSDWTAWFWPGNDVREGTGKQVLVLAKGDRVFYWKSSPVMVVAGLGEVRDVRRRKGKRTQVKVRVLTPEFSTPLHKAELARVPGLKDASFLKTGVISTFYRLTPKEAELLFQLVLANSPNTGRIWSNLEPRSRASDTSWRRIRGRRHAPDAKAAIAMLKNDPPIWQMSARRVRRGGKAFRDALLNAYRRRCSISGTTVEAVLDACHIDPHSRRGDNSLSNGILLRTDLHNLFDDGLIAIHPTRLTIAVAPELKDPTYRKLHGRRIVFPEGKARPSPRHLKARWEALPWLRIRSAQR